ncbi:hypothetical protein BHM03_00026468, partial [Ensete ventricosum]
ILGSVAGGHSISDQKNLDGLSHVNNAWMARDGWRYGIPWTCECLDLASQAEKSLDRDDERSRVVRGGGARSDGKRPRVRLGRSVVGVVELSFGFPFLREGHLRKASRAAMDGKQNKDGSLDDNSHSAAVSYVFNLKSLSSISMQDTFSIISSDKSKRRTQY